jgi:hypothetical protein
MSKEARFATDGFANILDTSQQWDFEKRLSTKGNGPVYLVRPGHDSRH